uniref:TRAP transporter large permease n=1 Tax=Fervidicoccus fontis TaxID=683846 RepID=A0A7J3ZJM8_9CREN
MDPIVTGILAYITLTLLLLLGMPVSFALAFTSLLFILVLIGPSELNNIGLRLYEALNDFSFLAIPLFVYLGAIVSRTRAGEEFYEAALRLLRRIPGSLAVSTIFTSTVFAALTGVSAAAAATVGKVAIPEMLKRNYHPRIVAGSVVAGGTLGILIPPSITLIVYGIATDTSIGKLFLGGVLPGLLLSGLYSVWTIVYYIYLTRRTSRQGVSGENGSASAGTRHAGGEASHAGERTLKLLIRTVPFVTIIILMLGSIYLGVASPTEAGAVGVLCALLVVTLFYRPSRRDYLNMIDDAVKESVFLLLIIAMSYFYGIVLTRLQFSQSIAQAIVAMNPPTWLLLVLINAFLFLLGMFLPPVSIIVITTPVLFPVIQAVGIDPIWYGVMLTINLEAGLITPPVGLNLFVVQGIAPQLKFSDIVRGSVPYIAMIFLTIVLIYLYPELVLWLPSKMITR